MNKVLIVIMFILLGTSLIVVSNMGKDVQNSFVLEYHNNKNIAYPDLSNATNLGGGLYMLYFNNNASIEYNSLTSTIRINTSSGATSNVVYNYITFPNTLDDYLTLSVRYISGTVLSGNNEVGILYNGSGAGIPIRNENYSTPLLTQTKNNVNQLLIYIPSGAVIFEYVFTIQLEKGTIPTSYVVPKLIPVYKDNLTQKEKNEIGIGAFGGITKIIKTISDIIKPVGDFINGILSIF